MSDVVWKKFGQPKVSNFWSEVFIKKNVTSFDISMHYRWHDIFMKICKTSCSTLADSRSFFPVQYSGLAV